MPSVTIDTHVLVTPSAEATADSVREHVMTLLDWKNLLGESWVTVHMSQWAVESLFEDDVYPKREALNRLFIEKGLEEFSADLVLRAVENLLQVVPYFEDAFGVTDVLHSDLVIEPDLRVDRTISSMASDLERCLVLAALVKDCCTETLTDHALVVKPPVGAIEVRVEATISCLEHCRDDLGYVPYEPDRFQSTVQVCQTVQQFIADLDEITLWLEADCHETAIMAVQLAVYKDRLERGVNLAWEAAPGFAFGRTFIASVKEQVQANPRRLLRRIVRAMVETIEGRQLSDVHALRENRSGNSPQRMRDGDKAWRRDIDREYHLHYWERADNLIEFASVGPHNDFSIPR